jgi:NAD+ synthase
MRVYGLSNWRNSAEAHEIFGTSGERIPQAIIDKEPSAELKPDQQDSDSLPPYPVLDDILERIMEKGENPVCVARDPKHDFGIVKWVYARLMAMEFKRRLGPLGPILSRYAFDRERRLPRVNGYNCFDYVQAA